MQNWLGGDPAPNVAGSRTWTDPSKYGPYIQQTSLIKNPVLMMVLLDEREDSINDGWWATDPDTLYRIVDFPASYHGQAAGIAFADGHSEIHKWRDARTYPVLHPGTLLTLDVVLDGDQDALWIAQHVLGAQTYP
jgi:prepilin-type processing-associated H-X9-DG protein